MKDLTLAQLDSGIDALIENASSLIAEAQLLLEHKHFARAFTLGHLAREELAKVTMLFAAGVRLIAGHPVEWVKLKRRFVSHKSKLTQDALWNVMSTGMAHTKEGEDLLKVLGAVTDVRNDAKNNSLYVGFKDDNFMRPRDFISERVAWRTVELARMSCDEWLAQRQATGKLADREPASMTEQFKGMPDIKIDKFEDFVALMRTGSTLMQMIRERVAEASKEKPPEGKEER